MTERFPQGLTKRQRVIVSVIRSRKAAEGGPCYVLPGERGHSDVYVPVAYGRTPEGVLHERLWTVANRTLKGVIDSGCVAIGPAEPSDGLRGLPPGRIVARLLPDWDWVEQRGAPLNVTETADA